MNQTSIEWVKNPDGSQGYTWNPITGCLNGCPYCYARRLANGRLRSKYLANRQTAHGSITPSMTEQFEKECADPFYPRFWEERIRELERGKFGAWSNYYIKPKGVFVCDMGELFGDWVPREWQEAVFEIIKNRIEHRFYLLTKQPQNLPNFNPFPENCWVGVTATDRASFDKAVHHLAEVEANIKYISFEPLLGPVFYDEKPFWGGVDWIIIGAQTKPYRPPEIESVHDIVSAADHAADHVGIPVFLKDNLKPLLETLNITGGTFGRLTRLTVDAIKDTQGLPRQRGWYQLRQELPSGY